MGLLSVFPRAVSLRRGAPLNGGEWAAQGLKKMLIRPKLRFERISTGEMVLPSPGAICRVRRTKQLTTVRPRRSEPGNGDQSAEALAGFSSLCHKGHPPRPADGSQ